ncbi:MAG: T9SS type A sorting domain-containing protein [Bacteroidota bacterium]|nr:T9SS type A sorting domain-containing protein [Bacteroidota bacterium]
MMFSVKSVSYNSHHNMVDVSMILPNDGTIAWSTFYGGGSGVDGADGGYGLANYQNNIYMVGMSNSVSPKIPLADVGGNAYYQTSLGGYSDGIFASFDTSPLLTIGIAGNEHTNHDFQIFPNPASDNINVLVNQISKSDVKIKIFDITGNCVYEEIYTNILGDKEIQVDMSSYSKSVYLIQITCNGQCFNKKVVLQ